MGLVIEELSHEDFPVEIVTVERMSGETVEPWRFISVNFDCCERLTPKELRQIGRWLQSQGSRIGREYTSSGRKIK